MKDFFVVYEDTWATEILLPELPACSVIVMDNTPPSTSGRTRWMRYRLRGIRCCGFRPIARILIR